ncbi:MAG: Hin recombinase [Deltaproteobacteria bacterium]|nr:Hin recombinase [Deltaproteobacteria bacterium]
MTIKCRSRNLQDFADLLDGVLRVLEQLPGPPKLSPERIKLARRLIDEGQPVRELADSFNVSHRNHLSTLKDSSLSGFCVPLLANA